MEGGKGEVLDVKSLYVLPSDTSITARLLSTAHEGCCRPEQLASVGDPPNCRASPPPGIFLMAGVGLERDVLVLLGELKLEWFLSTADAR